ncbi:hypothetical protein AMTRI_Chr13g125990 [Amborella trichopoda]
MKTISHWRKEGKSYHDLLFLYFVCFLGRLCEFDECRSCNMPVSFKLSPPRYFPFLKIFKNGYGIFVPCICTLSNAIMFLMIIP